MIPVTPSTCVTVVDVHGNACRFESVDVTVDKDGSLTISRDGGQIAIFGPGGWVSLIEDGATS